MKKLLVVLSVILLAGMIGITGCSGEEDIVEDDSVIVDDSGQEQDDTPVEFDFPVQNAADARDAVITYLREIDPENAPAEGLSWKEEDKTPSQLVGGSTRSFTSGDWTIDVQYPVVLLENTIYTVTVNGGLSGWYWKGEVNAQGEVSEIGSFAKITEDFSLGLAEGFVKSSPTYDFDGMQESFVFVKTLTLKCPYCWQFIFTFDSRQAGYGNRADMMLAQVITPHEALITVIQGRIESAVLDGKWDMLTQEMMETGEGATEEAVAYASVAAMLADPVYETTVVIEGEVSLLGELLCPCFELTSGGETVQVWYGLMVENDGTEKADVPADEISNGDIAVVTGVLKGPGGTHYSKGDFWAENIVPLP
ncbi:MAG: hypothetical protein JW712_05830 [Dehalococcoidales bacterium]|nr:hypothetical protein [Dehalococcoidales bacterium]